MRTKLFVIRKKDTDQYWNHSSEHGTGWNPGHPKQAFSPSELTEELNILINNDCPDFEIMELSLEKRVYITEISASIAKAIFECGTEYSQPITRIQFMSGKWPDHEKPQGGLNQEALRAVISIALDKIL